MSKEYYAKQPLEIEVFKLGDGKTDIILRRNIAEKQHPRGEEDVAAWECEEKQIRVEDVVSVEQIAEDFDDWWNCDSRDDPPSDAERLDAVEAAIMELAEVIAGG